MKISLEGNLDNGRGSSGMSGSLGFNRKVPLTVLLLLSVFLFLSLVFSQFTAAAEMPVMDDATCWSCHPTFVSVISTATSTTAVYGGMHPVSTIGCTKCHYTTIARSPKMNYCTNCHYNNYLPGVTPMLSSQHSADISFKNLAGVRHALSSKHQAASSQCTACHLPVLTEEHYISGRTDTNGQPVNCNTCHTGSFLGEEVSTGGILKIQKPVFTSAKWYPPEGRTISKVYIDASTVYPNGIEIYAQQTNGQWGFVYGRASGKVVKEWFELPAPAKGIYTKMYASTSYNYNIASTLDLPKVILSPNNADSGKLKTAIAGKDTRCEACHGESNHGVLHNSAMDANCLGTCHNANLTTEHINNTTTAGKAYTCDTCHSISGPANVKRTIAANNLNCAGCHSTGHNVNFTQGVPADIPLYEGFDWSAPLDAALFAGEPAAVPGYLDGSAKVVLSNRRTDVNASVLWDFYYSQLTQKGWTLNSAPPAQGAGSFTAEFVYGSRALTVKSYNTGAADGVGEALTAGYRVEIWFK